MKGLKHLGAALGLAFLFSVAHGQELQVVSASPKGENAAGARTAISVNFNMPVTALSESSAFAAEECPLQVLPTVEGTCRYSGTQTLLFEPKENWQNATLYHVTLPAGFKSSVSGKALAEDYSWTFSTSRPQVQNIAPYNNEMWIGTRPLIYVTLSQPVYMPSVEGAARLTYMGHEMDWLDKIKSFFNIAPEKTDLVEISVPLQVRALTDEEYEKDFSYMDRDRIFVLVPQKDLPPDTKVTLTLADTLRGKEGVLGLQEPYTSSFYTYPTLKITGGNYNGCLPFDAYVSFSSPVRLSDLLKHIQVSPASALLPVTEQEAQTLGRQRYGEEAGEGWFEMPLSFLKIEPRQTVTVTIDENLTDIYGSRLGSAHTLTVTNEGYCPAATFKGGQGVLESYLPLRHPIDVLNEKELEVSAGRFSKADFIPFNKKTVYYCSKAEIAKANLQFNGAYTFDEVPDKTQKTYLDLKKFNPTGQNSIIYSQVWN